MKYIAANANMLYTAVLTELIVRGDHVSPRDMPTRELLACHLTLRDPHQGIVTHPARKLNFAFMVAEWLWQQSGTNDADVILTFNKQLRMALDDGFAGFAGAYGPKIVEQLPYIVDTLRNEPSSRQAVLSIWRERPRASKDVPCTVSMQYILRDGELHAITYMRSNDAWLGLPYDLFNFTQLQRAIAAQLDVAVGCYHHMVGSMHLYERDVEKARDLLREARDDGFPSIRQTPLPSRVPPQLIAAFMELATYGFKQDYEWASAWYRRHVNLDLQWRTYLIVLMKKFWPREIETTPWEDELLHEEESRVR